MRDRVKPSLLPFNTCHGTHGAVTGSQEGGQARLERLEVHAYSQAFMAVVPALYQGKYCEKRYRQADNITYPRPHQPIFPCLPAYPLIYPRTSDASQNVIRGY